MGIVKLGIGLHDRVFGAVEGLAGNWFLGLAARIVFSSVLLVFFLNSVATKVGSGFPDMFILQIGAYAQILPSIAEAAGYDISAINLFPWKIIVLAGTCAEFVLPIMLLLGVFTRLTNVSLIGFIVVMSIVDIQFHGLDTASIGARFECVHDSVIADQQLLWIFPLIYLAVKGGWPISVDTILSKMRPQFYSPSAIRITDGITITTASKTRRLIVSRLKIRMLSSIENTGAAATIGTIVIMSPSNKAVFSENVARQNSVPATKNQ